MHFSSNNIKIDTAIKTWPTEMNGGMKHTEGLQYHKPHKQEYSMQGMVTQLYTIKHSISSSISQRLQEHVEISTYKLHP